MTIEATGRRPVGGVSLPDRLIWRYDGNVVADVRLESIEANVAVASAEFTKYRQPAK
jgi:hypothetical protein